MFSRSLQPYINTSPSCTAGVLPTIPSTSSLVTTTSPMTKSCAVSGSKGKVPPHVWQRCANLLLPHVQALFRQHLRAGDIALPTKWRDGWLHLFPKPNKPTKIPANLRPIALQCPLGKCLARVIKTRILGNVLQHLDSVLQYAYLPGRSTYNAISRIAQHCRAARREVHDRRAGRACVQAERAALLSIDIDEYTIHLTSALHQSSYHILHRNHEGCIRRRNGMRQGCVL